MNFNEKLDAIRNCIVQTVKEVLFEILAHKEELSNRHLNK